ncbi:hypothetical protein Q7P37_000342 [Cladosporium fusiforme]
MAEPFAILGAVVASMALLEKCKQIYDAASQATKHYEAIAENIPVVVNILENVQQVLATHHHKYNGQGYGAARQQLGNAEKSMQSLVASCRAKCDNLHRIFRKVMCDENATQLQRYVAAMRSLKPGREEKVIKLMREIVKKIQLLQSNIFFETVLRSASSRLRHRFERLWDRCLSWLVSLFRTLAEARRLPIEAAAMKTITIPMGATTADKIIWASK